MVNFALVCTLCLLTIVARAAERGALMMHADCPHPDHLRAADRMRVAKYAFALLTIIAIGMFTGQVTAS